MAPVDRSNPVRAKSSESRYSLMEFMREFPDDEACLRWLWLTRCAVDDEGKKAFCPKCELDRPFHRVSGRPAWDCDYCGYHMHPMAGTIFEKSSTSLQLWFYAMFLVSQTRCGVSAKQLERELGVTYKTAWRMLNKIRNQLMDESDDDPLDGDVEVDETFVGGKPRAYETRVAGKQRKGSTWRKETVLGLVERGGRVKVAHLPNRGGEAIKGTIYAHILPSAMIFTDEYPLYQGLDREYRGHRRVLHKERIYVDGDSHTQTVEGFFGLFKTGLRGVYHAVSAKWLQGYLNEYAWRYNRRHDSRPMFLQMVERAAT
jgi:transposase-like protein